MIPIRTKFKIQFYKHLEGAISFGILFWHGWGETYLTIDLFFWCIRIGKISVPEDYSDLKFGISKAKEDKE